MRRGALAATAAPSGTPGDGVEYLDTAAQPPPPPPPPQAVFAALSLALSFYYARSAWQQLARPWQSERGFLPANRLATFSQCPQLTAMLVVLPMVYACRSSTSSVGRSRHRRWYWPRHQHAASCWQRRCHSRCPVSARGAASWAPPLPPALAWRSSRRTTSQVSQRPPPSDSSGYVALCAFVDRTVRQMQREVEALRGAMYDFKTA
eukprot:SM000410S15574  [mRNA]  locus=s410:18811:22004:- [translate_table: standard]